MVSTGVHRAQAEGGVSVTHGACEAAAAATGVAFLPRRERSEADTATHGHRGGSPNPLLPPCLDQLSNGETWAGGAPS